MTRINLVPPSELCDQHLLAEYRELPRAITLAKPIDGPKQFVLGSGHMKFFYNKLMYLHIRYSDIVRELIKRGFNLDLTMVHSIRTSVQLKMRSFPELSNNYKPTPQALSIIRKRIKEKMTNKPRYSNV